MNTAIIVAAGSGTRFAAAHSKQFVLLLGKPLLIRTIEPFQACNAVDQIVLVLSDGGRDEFEQLSSRYDLAKIVSIVTGGDTRAASVRNGLAAIDSRSAEIVAVHDGARPIVTPDEITRTIEKAADTGAACLVADVTDTIKMVDGPHITCTIDRSKLKRALTPQAFRYDVIKRAFDRTELDELATDECSLVEKLGVNITFVEGSSRNIKVTYPEDLVLAEALLRDE